MDPNPQTPRPKQRTPVISDFVAVPRRATPGSEPTGPQAQPVSAAPAPTPLPAPVKGGSPAAQTAYATTGTSSLVGARPMTDIQPSRAAVSPVQPVAQAQPQSSTITTPAEPSRHTSFEPTEIPEVAPKELKIRKPHQGLRDVLSIFGVLASALALAFCLITFVFQSYQVDGPSMQTTLQNNDHLIVWKVSKTIANLTGRHYIPNRGDVIVFNEHTADSGDGDKQLIKRVIGLPGERVVVKNNQITVYNKQFPNGFSPDKTLPYGKVIVTTPGNADVTLGDDEIYVCGDNRTNSLDSRVFGPIESKQIVGKLVLRVLPLNAATKF